MKSFVFTARSRKIHPFDDNNNHVSAAQLWKYPERERDKDTQVMYYFGVYYNKNKNCFRGHKENIQQKVIVNRSTCEMECNPTAQP